MVTFIVDIVLVHLEQNSHLSCVRMSVKFLIVLKICLKSLLTLRLHLKTETHVRAILEGHQQRENEKKSHIKQKVSYICRKEICDDRFEIMIIILEKILVLRIVIVI